METTTPETALVEASVNRHKTVTALLTVVLLDVILLSLPAVWLAYRLAFGR